MTASLVAAGTSVLDTLMGCVNVPPWQMPLVWAEDHVMEETLTAVQSKLVAKTLMAE